MNPLPPDRRDDLLHDLYNDDAGAVLASRMAARIRHKRHLRQAATACAFIAIIGLGLFQVLPRSSKHIPPVAAAKIPASATDQLPASAVATDADLLAALKDERVMIFTLADGQRQVVWLGGSPAL